MGFGRLFARRLGCEPAQEQTIGCRGPEPPHPRAQRPDDDARAGALAERGGGVAHPRERADGARAGADPQHEPVGGQIQLGDALEDLRGLAPVDGKHPGREDQTLRRASGPGEHLQCIGARGVVHPQRVEAGGLDLRCEARSEIGAGGRRDPDRDACAHRPRSTSRATSPAAA